MQSYFFIYLLLLTSLVFCKNDQYRVDCAPDGKGEVACMERSSCSWESTPRNNPQNLPQCVRAEQSAYNAKSGDTNYIELQYNGLKDSFDDAIQKVNVNWTFYGSTMEVLISAEGRFSPPVDIPRESVSASDSFTFVHTAVTGTPNFAFQVVRASTGTVVFDTTVGGFFFSDQFMEIASYLPSTHVFGLGERLATKLMHETSKYIDYPMLATGRAPNMKTENLNLNGVHPFYLCVESDGKAHGVLFFNSDPQEIELGPLLTYRTTGGSMDMVFFPGPKPEDVIKQYTAYIGKPSLPSYWSLGYQYGRGGLANLDQLKLDVNKIIFNAIPLDAVQFNYEYESEYETFTVGKDWSDMGNYVDTLHTNGIYSLIEVDPVLASTSHALQRAKASDVAFISWPTAAHVPKINSKYPLTDGTNYILGGSVLPSPAVFLDFLDLLGKTGLWWQTEFTNFYKTVNFDGIVLNRNEPYNSGKELECPSKGNNLDYPPYKLMTSSEKDCMCADTVCMEGKTGRAFYNFYDTRSLYGWSQSKETFNAAQTIRGKRATVLSRSTFVNSGQYAGHWLDGFQPTWEYLKAAAVGVMNFNMFGIPLVGSDICGSTGKVTEELCIRWYQLAAFHSLSRSNHDSSSDVSPYYWDSVTKGAQAALKFKYLYAPYLYSLHYRAYLNGGTVIRPLFFEFPADTQAMSADYQFMWGEAVMVSPAVDPGVTTVHTYFPSDIWYSLSPTTYGSKMSSVYYQEITAPINTIAPVFARGGYIIPRQAANLTLNSSRKNPFEILITIKNKQNSTGELYFDDGESVIQRNETNKRTHWMFTFSFTDTVATVTGVVENNSNQLLLTPSLDTVEIFGYGYQPNMNSIKLNDSKVSVNLQKSSFSAITQRLILTSSSLVPLQGQTSFVLQWNHSSL